MEKMEKAVHQVGREESRATRCKTERPARPPLAGEVAFRMESGEKYVGIHLHSHGIFKCPFQTHALKKYLKAGEIN